MTLAMVAPALAVCLCGVAYGQAADPPLTFEVASVKPSPPPGNNGIRRIGCRGGPGSTDPGLYTCVNSDINQLLIQAYGLKRYQLPSLAPGLVIVLGDTARFDITAKVPAGTTKPQLQAMLQSLLAERFKLKFHWEKKELQVYDLVVAKGGLKMKESPPPDPQDADAPKASPPPPPTGKMSMGRPATGPDGLPALPPPRRNSSQMVFSNGRMRMVTTDSTMQEIATMLTGQVGRPVTDSTGLTGKYDYTLTFASETMGGGGGAALVAASDSGPLLDPDGDNGPTIFSAVQEQLGLKLEQKKGTVDMFVIDHVEKMPTEN